MEQIDNTAGRGPLSRRDMLQGAAAGVAAVAAGAVLAGCARQAEEAMRAPARVGGGVDALPKRFSQEEMTRRVGVLRAAMRSAGYDGLLLSTRPDGNGDIGWLTGYPASYAVFAMDGMAKVIGGEGEIELYEGVEKSESEDGRASTAISAAIRELGLSRGRIGVGYLQDIVRLPEGGMNYTTFDRVRRANSGARFEAASDLLLMVKLPRSAEEIAVLEHAHAISEAALATLMRTARPNTLHSAAWLATWHTLVAGSNEFPTRLSLRSGKEGNTGGQPFNEKMLAGTICNQEISASVLGYGSQVNQSFLIGGPAPADWESAGNYCLDLFHRLVEHIKPGMRVMDASAFYEQEVLKRGDIFRGVVFHSGGNNDGPRWGPGRSEALDAVFQEGMVFTIKPRIPIKGVEAPAAQFGDGVVVTATGARRLGKRKLELVTVS
jgi:Xaa-Pro aminopeptidase